MRKRRKGGPPLSKTQHTMNLAMALLRADAAAQLLNDADNALPATTRDRFVQMKQELMTQKLGPTGRWFSYLQLYYATVHVVIRTWQRGHLVNTVVDDFLANAEIVQMVTDFRDDLMHGGAFLGDEIARFFNHSREIETWSNQLRVACAEHVVRFFATPRTGPD